MSQRKQQASGQGLSTRSRTILSAAVALALAGPALAADGVWSGAGGDGLWSNTANWTAGAVADGSGSTGTFSLDLTADNTVHLDTARTIGNLVFGDTDPTTAGNWILDNNATAANVLTLDGGTPTITVNAMNATSTATISAVLAGSAGLNVAGAGTLVLKGANTFTNATTGAPNISVGSGATLGFTTNGALGGAGSILVNGGTLSYRGTTGGPTINHMITIGANGANIDSFAAGGAGKWVLNSGGKLDGSGNMTKTGAGWLTIYGAGTTYTGTSYISNGVLEAGNAASLGSGQVYVNGGTIDTGTGALTGGGFLSLNMGGTTFPNEIHVNQGTIGSDNPSGAHFGGLVHFEGLSRVQMGNFWGGGNSNVFLNGGIDGSGDVVMTGGGGNPGSATGAGQTMSVNGDYSNYTGVIHVGPGFNAAFGGYIVNNLSTPQVLLTSTATSLAGVGQANDPMGTSDNQGLTGQFGDGADPAHNTFANGGVFGINSGATVWTTPVNLATFYGGNFYLGSQTTGTYGASSLKAGTGNTYRLGGGGGTLVIANANLVTGANAVNIGAAMDNGSGTVRFGGAQNYTGATNIINGTLQTGAANAIPSASAITMGGLNGTTQYAGTLDLYGNNLSLNSLPAVAAGADATKQTITNNGGAAATLTVDTSSASGVSTWAGPMKDGSKALGLAVQGSNAANGVVLSNASTSLSNGVSVNRVTLTVGPVPTPGTPNANGAKIAGPVTFANNGTLVLNSTANMSLGLMSGAGNLVHSGSGNVTLGANNAGFTGGITVNGGGTLTAGLSTPGVYPLSNSAITLAGGKLAVQGQMTSTGVVQSVAPVAGLSGWNKDTIYGATETKFFPNNLDPKSTPSAGDANNSLMDGYYSYYQNGYVVPANATPQNAVPAGTVLNTGGLTGQTITSAITNSVTGGNTQFTFQDFTKNNTFQVLGGKNGVQQGTMTLTPSGFKNLSVLAVSTWAGNDSAPMTLNFTDGTSVTVPVKAYDWYVGGDATKQAADSVGGGLNRYTPVQTPGWDTRGFGMYETDIDLTNVNGTDYSGKVVSSITFTGLNTNMSQDQRTNIFAMTGQAIPVVTNATQTYTNSVAVSADSGVDVSGSLNASFGPLALGAKLSATSADTTTSPYSVAFGATSLSGTAAVDVAASAGGGAGTVKLGAVSGSGGLAVSGAGTVKLTAGGSMGGTLAINGGHLEVDANTTAGGLAGTGGSLNVAAGNLSVGPSTGTATKLNSLTIASGSKLDVNNNNLVIAYGTGANPTSTIVGELLSGRNGGAWNGNGIASSAAAANANHTTAIGYAEASQLLGTSASTTATWNGQTVDGSSLLLKYTYYGDLNLDGKVNADDYALIDKAYAKGGQTGWVNGDVNYDGVINSADYLLMDTAMGKQNGVLSPDLLAERQVEFGSAYVAALTAAVPEPASLGLLGLAAVGLMGRRRRK